MEGSYLWAVSFARAYAIEAIYREGFVRKDN
jgi:hypothetical protein